MMDTDTVPATIEEADDVLTTVTEDAPEIPAAEPAAKIDGRVRDEQGRFTTPPEAEPQAAQAELAPTPETPEPQTTEAPVEESFPEFSYRADGQELSIPGSAVGDDGVFIPQSHLPEIQQLLASGRAATRAFGDVRQRLSDAAIREKAANDRTTAAEAHVQQILGHFENLIERGEIGPWLENVGQNWPVLKAQAQAKAVEMQNASERERLRQYEAREKDAQLRPLMAQTLSRTVQEYGQQAGLDAAAMQAVQQKLNDPMFESVLFVKAPYDDPMAGLRQGELAINKAVVQQAIQLASLGRPAPARVPAKAAAPVQVPPTVGRSAAAPARTIPKPKSRQEADDLLLNGDLNAFEEG